MSDGKRYTDQMHLNSVIMLIRGQLPLAHHMRLQTSDQSLYGFTLAAIEYDNDVAIDLELLPGEVVDQINDMLSDIDWDGVVGESPQGYAVVPLVPR